MGRDEPRGEGPLPVHHQGHRQQEAGLSFCPLKSRRGGKRPSGATLTCEDFATDGNIDHILGGGYLGTYPTTYTVPSNFILVDFILHQGVGLFLASTASAGERYRGLALRGGPSCVTEMYPGFQEMRRASLPSGRDGRNVSGTEFRAN